MHDVASEAAFARADGFVPTTINDWSRCLRIGVTGHRPPRLAGSDRDGLAQTVAATLALVEAALPGAAAPHLVSSLAEGADSIIADAALARGWRLDVVLPLPREDFASDFPAGPERDAHARRIATANAVLELPSEGDRLEAYERAGRVMLAQSDLVVAIWDGQPARGRGGAAQIIAEAVLRGIPVIHLDPAMPDAPALLWDGLDEHDFGQQSIETVARGGLDRLPDLIEHLTGRSNDPLSSALLASLSGSVGPPRPRFAIAYPLLLAIMGVGRRWRRGPTTMHMTPTTEPAALPSAGPRDEGVQAVLATWFARADAQAVVAAQTFRSAYVTNFALAALSVMISLSGLALPFTIKPGLALAELATIAGILAVTRRGRRARWQQRWLNERHLAERLRCLAITSRLGELGLRRGCAAEGSTVTWAMHAAARMVGLPCIQVDRAYLAGVRAALLDLLDRQVAYLERDHTRMRTLEHRLHRLGTLLFATTALLCSVAVSLELAVAVTGAIGEDIMHRFSLAATIISAALPACGAAIYGIRMQGDFAGTAERSGLLAAKLSALRKLTAGDPLRFDLLWIRTRRATDLLTDDLSAWLHAYRARPLTLPG